MLQMRRPPGMSIVRPAVFSRPGRFEHSNRFAPGQRVPGLNPGVNTHFNGPNGINHNHANTNVAPNIPRQNAVNVPGPNNGPHFHQPGPNQVQGQPNFRQNNQFHPNNQVRPQFQQRVQNMPHPKPPPKAPPCKGKGCRR
jgi:hypothetical protein